jgi:putative FmdB family regulatory protein
MPTYQYICKKCGFEMEELQSITAPPLVHCPNCKTDNLARAVGAGGGLIFKGSGFYLTDYKKETKPHAKGAHKKDKKEEKPAEKKNVKPDNSTKD